MTEDNFLNVFKGPDSVQQYFNPDSGPPLPLVELPDCLNPYRQDGVRIYAKMMTMHPANNVKALPALNLLDKTVAPEKTKTIIEYSSGSTVISMALVSRVFHEISDVRAFLSNKTSSAKLRLMRFFGLNITLFGGPSQPEPTDDRGGIRIAQRLAEETDHIVNPNQYENDENWKAHVRWTGPQILKQLPEVNLVCAGMGTSGTITGLGTYFGQAKPSVFRLGVCTQAGDRVPGPRSFSLLAPVKFPWKEAIDSIEEVGSHDSFTLSLELCRQGIVCGPSSGFNLKGLYQFIQKRKLNSTLSELSGADSVINCVFLCCDLPYQYIDEYFDKLGPSHFPPIKNENLGNVDLYRYDDAWERDISLQDLLSLGGNVSLLDLRQPAAFSQLSLPGSINLPCANPEDNSPFFDSDVLSTLWTELDSRFDAGEKVSSLVRDKRIIVLCYNGDCSRVATSVLRAKGYIAESVKGGFNALPVVQEPAAGYGLLGVASENYKQLSLVTKEVEVMQSG
ncbi:tryptophan synthase beta subunit-like PLP-dependent enzyme [Biscogniauxia marginata]|nr:tryptophan synthase beta subunit-like PLP-dependent enzyme [Biscogniauxia marginata]